MSAPVLNMNETHVLVRPLWTALVVALLSLLAACGPSSTPAEHADQVEQERLPIELQRKAGEGEQCIVCDQPIQGGEVIELRYKGRRIYVATPLLQDLLDDPDRYFAKRQARTALFDEESHAGQPSNAWLYFGIYVLAGLVFAALCGYVAITRAMPPLPWFFAGLLGNVAALLVLLAVGKGDPSAAPAGIPAGLAKVPATRSPVLCSACGHLNHPSAASCGGCANPVRPSTESEVTRVLKGGAS